MELKFLPLAAGALHLEAVRVVDAVTNEATYIRDLPDIIASSKDEEA
jgi:TRAPP trafficking subunit Trs65